jgi:hypothetical protein
MNTYSKYCPNVYIAKCTEQHEKGEVIQVTTKYGKENPCIVYNLVCQNNGFYYYSIVREDGLNRQNYAEKKASKLNQYAANSKERGENYYNASNKDRDFLSLGEPIKVGHHSERKHRKIIEQAHNNFGKFMEQEEKAEGYENRAKYWESMANKIDLSMPESIEYFTYELEKAKKEHDGLKNGTIGRSHSFSLTYANKKVKETELKLKTAKKLWA